MYKFAIAHLLVSLVYSFLASRSNNQGAVTRFSVVFFVPVFGLLLLIITDVFKRTSEKNENDLKLESDLLKLAEESTIFRRADVSKEMNIVPVDDILLLNDTSTRRKMLIDVLKEQTIWQIGTLETALQNEDSETVHYAAAALTEMRRKLQLQLQDLSVKYEENKQDIEVLKAYAQVLKKYLESALLDRRTYLKYSYTYSFVLGSILDIYQDEAIYFVEKINCELAIQSYEQAAQYCRLFHESHPDSDQPYVLTMKLCYTMRDYAGFRAEMNRLKSSSVKISHQTLMLIRYWSNLGAEHSDESIEYWSEEDYGLSLAEVAATKEEGLTLKEKSEWK
ncbi:hypothetical protein [Brevibacillus sp. NRS-1366]|uniref:hypothetical protein n=1 Tax=Brevibacillus sp. NRS-1366 TaxID=3233899 RepID=UPI003D1CD8CF